MKLAFTYLGRLITKMVLIMVVLSFFVHSVAAQESELQVIQNQLSDLSLLETTGSYTEYLPYGNFNNYCYIDSSYGLSHYMILEFARDNHGRYQIVSLSNNEASARVYQVRTDGIYEVLREDPYFEVQDLRYSDQINSDSGNLVIPSALKKGVQFASGMNGENRSSIIAILPTFSSIHLNYEQVVVIEEAVSYSGMTNLIYFAPYYGIVKIQRFDQVGQLYEEINLLEVNNAIS